MKTVSFATNDRIPVLKKVIESFLAADGNEGWLPCFSMEPVDEVVDYVSSIKRPMILSKNALKKGIDANTFLAADLAFSVGSDFNLYLEDDSILSKDALSMVDQFRKLELDRPSVICLRRWHEKQDLDQTELVTDSPNMGLLGNGFGYSMDCYRKFIRSWWFHDWPACLGWDWAVSKGLDTNQVRQFRPMVNRSQNIGHHGTNNNGGTDPNHFGPCYDGCVTGFEFRT